MPEYVTKVETNFFGEREIVTRLRPSTADLVAGTAVIGISAVLWMASQETKAVYKRIEADLKAATAMLNDGDFPGVYHKVDELLTSGDAGKKYVAFVTGHYLKGRAARFEGSYQKGIEYATYAVDYTAEARSSKSEHLEMLQAVAEAAWFDRGCCYLALDDNVNAVREFTGLLQANPGYSPARNARAVVLRRLGNCDAARRDLDAALEVHPDVADHYIERAKTHAACGAQAQARADFQQGIHFAAKAARPYRERAVFLMASGEYTAASADLDMAVTLEPNAAANLSLRAAARRGLGREQEAAADAAAAERLEQFAATYAGYLSRAQELYYKEDQKKIFARAQTKTPDWGALALGVAVLVLGAGLYLMDIGDDRFLNWALLPALGLLMVGGMLIWGALRQPVRARKHLALLESEERRKPGFGAYYAEFVAAKKATALAALEEKMRRAWANGAALP